MHLWLICGLIATILSSATLIAGPLKCEVVSYNIRYAAKDDRGLKGWWWRKDKITGYLAKKQASIIGLQEVLHRQLLDVKKALPQYRVIGVGREDGKTAGEYSPILYDVHVWESDPKQQGTFWLSDSPATPNSKSWGNDTTRICTWVRLIHKQSRRSIYVFNTHWDHLSEPFRDKAARLILKKMSVRQCQDDPVILMGDFNTTTESTAIQILLKSKWLRDPSTQQWLTFNQWGSELIVGRRIDHIFFSKHWKQATLIVEANGLPLASDHHPVVGTAVLE